MPRFKEHAMIVKRQKSRKMHEASYECTLELESPDIYLGIPVHVNDIIQRNGRGSPSLPRKHPTINKQTNKGCMNNTRMTTHDIHLKPIRDLRQ